MFNNLSKVEAMDVANAAVKLEKLDIGWTQLKSDQITTLFERLTWKDVVLTELKLSGLNLKDLDCGFFRAVPKLRVVDLNYTKLNQHQLRALFCAMEDKGRRRSRRGSRSRHRSRSMKTSRSRDRSRSRKTSTSRDRNRSRKTSTSRDRCRGRKTSRSRDRSRSRKTSSSRSQLTDLTLSSNDISQISPETLVAALRKLERINLSETELTEKQAQAIFTHSTKFKKLRHLNIKKNNLDHLAPYKQYMKQYMKRVDLLL